MEKIGVFCGALLLALTDNTPFTPNPFQNMELPVTSNLPALKILPAKIDPPTLPRSPEFTSPKVVLANPSKSRLPDMEVRAVEA